MQPLSLDRWLEKGGVAFNQTMTALANSWANCTASLGNIIAWPHDRKHTTFDAASEPKLGIITECNHQHNLSTDIVNSDLNSLKFMFKDIQSILNSVALKLKDDVQELAVNCEEEIRDIWLSWHLQFMPLLD